MAKKQKKREKKDRPREIGIPPVIVKEIPLDDDQLNLIGLTPLCQVDAICRGYPMPLYFATADGACREALTISDVWHDHGTTPDGWDTIDVRDMMTRYREMIHKAFDLWWYDGEIPEASKRRLMDAMRDAVETIFAAEREDVVRALNRMRGTPNRWLWDRGVVDGLGNFPYGGRFRRFWIFIHQIIHRSDKSKAPRTTNPRGSDA